jgi:hypothetical protein
MAAPRRAELRTLRNTLAKNPKQGSFVALVRQQLHKLPRDCRELLVAHVAALKAKLPQTVLDTLQQDVVRLVSPAHPVTQQHARNAP